MARFCSSGAASPQLPLATNVRMHISQSKLRRRRIVTQVTSTLNANIHHQIFLRAGERQLTDGQLWPAA